MASPIGVALVTGGSSGIGLALTKHLLSKGWSITNLDLFPPNPEESASLPSDRVQHIRTDVSSWDDLAAGFQKAYEKHSRLDFVALNAGIDDRDDIFSSVSGSVDRSPREPNMATLQVNLFGVYYGIKLAAHYFGISSPRSTTHQAENGIENGTGTENGNGPGPGSGGKIVITASSLGLYAFSAIPQYTASKHALVGLTRALAPFAEKRNVRINAICPRMVPTGLAPPGLLEVYEEKEITPMSTIIRAYDELAEFDGIKEREGWVRHGHNGQIVDASLDKLFYNQERPMPEQENAAMTPKQLDAWHAVNIPRNVKFANQDWKR